MKGSANSRRYYFAAFIKPIYLLPLKASQYCHLLRVFTFAYLPINFLPEDFT